KINKPIILAANKADSSQAGEGISDFYRLGLSSPVAVSAMHGLNINYLLDKICEALPLEGKGGREEGIKVAVVGRPNVGKSSFINTLLQEERLIVDKKPGTTRDAIDTAFHLGEEKFVFVDTAGMRPRGKVKRGVESYSVIRTRRSIERGDIALIMIDAGEGFTSQDARIASYVYEQGRGCIIGVNKWDLIVEGLKSEVESKINDRALRAEIKRVGEEYRKVIREKLKFLNFAPLIFISALTGERVFEVINLVRTVTKQQTSRPSIGALTKVFEEAVAHYRPPGGQAKPVTLHRLSQVGIKPPTFVLFANHPQFITESYLRYLSNRLRQAFGFEGTPLKIIPRKGR
ncbi:MAG: GTP-binding protein, partial [Nitrospirae bacterium]|nr:GTP-binding protein [Nitrospirota bacterium]